MPSGITSDIYENKATSLRDYLMGVGRQMGFAIMQRDDDWKSPVKPVEPSPYHREAIEEAEARIAEVKAWTDDEAEQAAREAFDAEYRRWLDTRNEKGKLRDRYENMVEQVEAWQPDPLVAFVKDHALKYLRESIEFDCGKGGDDMRWYPEPTFVAGPGYREQELAKARRDAEYHHAEHVKEVARADERNRHIEAFLRSLPDG